MGDGAGMQKGTRWTEHVTKRILLVLSAGADDSGKGVRMIRLVTGRNCEGRQVIGQGRAGAGG